MLQQKHPLGNADIVRTLIGSICMQAGKILLISKMSLLFLLSFSGLISILDVINYQG